MEKVTLWGRREVYAGIWCGNMREIGHLEDPRRRWEDYIKMDLQEVGCGGGNGLDQSGSG